MSPEAGGDPRHHPQPEDLLEYASGASPEWLSLMIACHLTYCPRCRAEVAELDELGGALLEGLDVVHEGEGAIELPHARPAPPPRPPPARLDPRLQGVVPLPLHPYVASSEGRLRTLAPGIEHVPLRSPDADVQLRLLRFRPGYVIPSHGHRGLEWLLILDGDIGDSAMGERYGRGDVCRSEVGKVHAQDVSRQEPCVALVANLGRLVPTNLLARILARIVGV